MLLTFRLNTAVQNNGLGLELDVVAIVLLGGVSIFGGKGSLIGVVLAVLAFAGIQNALFLTNFNQEAAGIVTGALLLAVRLRPQRGVLRAGCGRGCPPDAAAGDPRARPGHPPRPRSHPRNRKQLTPENPRAFQSRKLKGFK